MTPLERLRNCEPFDQARVAEVWTGFFESTEAALQSANPDGVRLLLADWAEALSSDLAGEFRSLDPVAFDQGVDRLQSRLAHAARLEADPQLAIRQFGGRPRQVLEHLASMPTAFTSQAEITGQLAKHTTYASKILRLLEEHGLIYRWRSEADARVKQVGITTAGRNALAGRALVQVGPAPNHPGAPPTSRIPARAAAQLKKRPLALLGAEG